MLLGVGGLLVEEREGEPGGAGQRQGAGLGQRHPGGVVGGAADVDDVRLDVAGLGQQLGLEDQRDRVVVLDEAVGSGAGVVRVVDVEEAAGLGVQPCLLVDLPAQRVPRVLAVVDASARGASSPWNRMCGAIRASSSWSSRRSTAYAATRCRRGGGSSTILRS